MLDTKAFDREIYLLLQNTYLQFFQDNTPVKTGEMKRSWEIEKVNDKTWKIFNSAEHAVFREFGTGIHGPKHQYITPVNKKALRWFVNNKPVFAKKVKGIQGLFLLEKAKHSSQLQEKFKKELDKIIHKTLN